MNQVLNALKAVSESESEIRVGNYIVLFGGRDLQGEFFTKSTNFDSKYTDIGMLYVDFEHGRDAEKAGNSPDNILGMVDWKSAKADDTGIFVERVLSRRSSYVQLLSPLIEAGVLGTSSQAISSGVQTKKSGEIVKWPLMRDSLTVSPVEPRMISSNVLTAAKSLREIFPASKSLAALTGEPTPPTTIRDFEEFLRDAGFSKAQAVAIASGGFKAMPGRRDAGDAEAAESHLLDFIKSMKV